MQEAYTNKVVVRAGFYPKVVRGKKKMEAEPGDELMLSDREVKLHRHQIEIVKGGGRTKPSEQS